ncbi:MAG: hypothetical protein DRO87_06515 [Candidatus Thorarchaeota archaeon]|nr:MAG: hypothetical protein DRO87_06515 [Candidatus Thorarchaeota archaeon]RLI58290.1 MAG: hypothetical protein DRP09_00715 [Candidatus Thorarchaeota archaeon]
MSSLSGVGGNVTRLLGDVGITPRGVQTEAIDAGLLEGQSVMVVSPTGSGKTLVGEMALLRAVIEGKRGVYLVPLRALAYEVARSLKSRYEDKAVRIGVTTGDLHLTGDEMAEFDIIVTTYERADSLLRHQTSWLPSIGTVVIDEIQTMSEGRRGARLESVILRLKQIVEGIQIVALSATIKYPDELASWLECELILSSDRPVPLVNKVFVAPNRAAAVQRTVMTVVQNNGQVLVFHRTRREAEAEAIRLAEEVGRQLSSADKKALDDHLVSDRRLSSRIAGTLRRILHEGVAYHHAGIGSTSRALVERLFRKGLLRVICATTTLASGINLPARTVILTSVRSPDRQMRWLSANSVHQMLGRAGRPGHDRKGFGVILAGSRGEAEDITNRYFTRDTENYKEVLRPVFDRITSQIGKEFSITEQVLVILDLLHESTAGDIEDYLANSYLSFSGSRYARSPMRLLNIQSATAEAAVELHSLFDTVQACRRGLLGTANIRESNQEVIGGIVTGFEGGHFSCRFSARVHPSGTVEGASCSCGNSIDDDGILCVHLVSLGLEAAHNENTRELADYVIPLALEVASPIRTLTRLGLAEGGSGGKIRITRLGRSVNRLYLSVPTVRELLARLPFTDDSVDLMSLLRHAVSIEGSITLDESFVQFVGEVATTSRSIREIADDVGIAIGDALGLLDRTRWMLSAISVLADHGGLEHLKSMCKDLLQTIGSRLEDRRNDDGDY